MAAISASPLARTMATRGFRLRVEIQLGEHVTDDAHMILGLFEVPLPFSAEVLVHGASIAVS